jgi:predicted DNA-binding transcriptional regulator AlpA
MHIEANCNRSMMPQQTALPANLPPRLATRTEAAAYVGLSPNTFDQLVVSGRMPKPRHISEGRIGWDVRELDAAVDELPVKSSKEPAA